MTGADSPAVARVRENVRYLSDSHAEDVEAVLAELDEARRELERLRGVQPRVWLEGDTVPAGVWALDLRGYVDGYLGHVTAEPLVEVFVPDFAAAVAAERERRAAQIDSKPPGDPLPPNPVPEPSAGADGALGRHGEASAGDAQQPDDPDAAQGPAPDSSLPSGSQPDRRTPERGRGVS